MAASMVSVLASFPGRAREITNKAWIADADFVQASRAEFSGDEFFIAAGGLHEDDLGNLLEGFEFLDQGSQTSLIIVDTEMLT